MLIKSANESCTLVRPLWQLLAADKSSAVMTLMRALLHLDAKSIRVSEYLTALPPLPLPLLRQRLHQAIEHAREQAARRLPKPKDLE